MLNSLKNRFTLIIALIIVIFVITTVLVVYTYLRANEASSSVEYKDKQITPALGRMSNQETLTNVNDLINNGKIDEAEKLLKLQKDYDSSLDLHLAFAQSQVKSGDVDAALTTLKDAESISPDMAHIARATAGMILRNAGRKSEALIYYKQAIELANKVSSDDEDVMRIAAFRSVDYQDIINRLKAGGV